MINLRANDGSATPPLTMIPGPAGPGVYQLTKGCKAAIAYNWQFVTPFGIPSASDYMLGPPPALTSKAFTKAYNEVKTVGAIDSTERPPDRANVALYFAATSPTQAMNQAAREVAEEQGGSLSENARALALMNMAINDSLVASFLNKYHYNFWRPETAIHTANIAGNPKIVADPDWAPFIVTPCFPSYPSNHGSAVNAAGEVLRRLYGEAGHLITLTNTATPTITLQYDSFTEIDDDVSDARVYGGIHFRTDQEAGSDLGNAIGAAVYKSNFRPRCPLSILPADEHRWCRTTTEPIFPER
jgi:membrane-associated phospholipid phosphatase